MMFTKRQQLYLISHSESLVDIERQLNIILSSIATRLDAIEATTRINVMDEQSHISDAETSHSAATTTELNALGTVINSILAALESNDIVADS